jgi:hypothetical protein
MYGVVSFNSKEISKLKYKMHMKWIMKPSSFKIRN